MRFPPLSRRQFLWGACASVLPCLECLNAYTQHFQHLKHPSLGSRMLEVHRLAYIASANSPKAFSPSASATLSNTDIFNKNLLIPTFLLFMFLTRDRARWLLMPCARIVSDRLRALQRTLCLLLGLGCECNETSPKAESSHLRQNKNRLGS